MRQNLARLWRGELRLPRAFWDYAIIYGSLLNLFTTLAALAALASGLPGAPVLAIFLLPAPYNILVVVGVWRSAARYDGPPVWANLSRIAVVVWAIVATLA